MSIQFSPGAGSVTGHIRELPPIASSSPNKRRCTARSFERGGSVSTVAQALFAGMTRPEDSTDLHWVKFRSHTAWHVRNSIREGLNKTYDRDNRCSGPIAFRRHTTPSHQFSVAVARNPWGPQEEFEVSLTPRGYQMDSFLAGSLAEIGTEALARIKEKHPICLEDTVRGLAIYPNHLSAALALKKKVDSGESNSAFTWVLHRDKKRLRLTVCGSATIKRTFTIEFDSASDGLTLSYGEKTKLEGCKSWKTLIDTALVSTAKMLIRPYIVGVSTTRPGDFNVVSINSKGEKITQEMTSDTLGHTFEGVRYTKLRALAKASGEKSRGNAFRALEAYNGCVLRRGALEFTIKVIKGQGDGNYKLIVTCPSCAPVTQYVRWDHLRNGLGFLPTGQPSPLAPVALIKKLLAKPARKFMDSEIRRHLLKSPFPLRSLLKAGQGAITEEWEGRFQLIRMGETATTLGIRAVPDGIECGRSIYPTIDKLLASVGLLSRDLVREIPFAPELSHSVSTDDFLTAKLAFSTKGLSLGEVVVAFRGTEYFYGQVLKTEKDRVWLTRGPGRFEWCDLSKIGCLGQQTGAHWSLAWPGTPPVDVLFKVYEPDLKELREGDLVLSPWHQILEYDKDYSAETLGVICVRDPGRPRIYARGMTPEGIRKKAQEVPPPNIPESKRWTEANLEKFPSVKNGLPEALVGMCKAINLIKDGQETKALSLLYLQGICELLPSKSDEIRQKSLLNLSITCQAGVCDRGRAMKLEAEYIRLSGGVSSSDGLDHFLLVILDSVKADILLQIGHELGRMKDAPHFHAPNFFQADTESVHFLSACRKYLGEKLGLLRSKSAVKDEHVNIFEDAFADPSCIRALVGRFYHAISKGLVLTQLLERALADHADNPLLHAACYKGRLKLREELTSKHKLHSKMTLEQMKASPLREYVDEEMGPYAYQVAMESLLEATYFEPETTPPKATVATLHRLLPGIIEDTLMRIEVIV